MTATATTLPQTSTTPETAERLMELALPAIRHTARSMAGKHGFKLSDREDIAQELSLILWRRIPNYDSNLSLPSTFIARCVDHARCDLIRQQQRQVRDPKRCTSLDKIIEDDNPDNNFDGSNTALLDRYQEYLIENCVLRWDLNDHLGGFSDTEQQILKLLPDYNNEQIKEQLGLSRREFDACLKHIRYELEDYDPTPVHTY